MVQTMPLMCGPAGRYERMRISAWDRGLHGGCSVCVGSLPGWQWDQAFWPGTLDQVWVLTIIGRDTKGMVEAGSRQGDPSGSRGGGGEMTRARRRERRSWTDDTMDELGERTGQKWEVGSSRLTYGMRPASRSSQVPMVLR
jgi:hypothetical protein